MKRRHAFGSGGILSQGPLAVSAAGFTGDLKVGGVASVGVRLVNCAMTTPIQHCSCAAGETVVSGGGFRATGGDAIRASYPVSTTAWQIICTNSAGTDVNCGGMNIICARLAP